MFFRRLALVLPLLLIAAVAHAAPQAVPQDDTPSRQASEPAVAPDDQRRAAQTPLDRELRRDPVVVLLGEIERMKDVISELRQQVADARLDAADAQRELEELRQFIEDHETLRDDFQRYRGVREVAEQEARRQRAEEARALHEQQEAERRAQRLEARARRAAERAEAERLDRYRDQGFAPLGLDVFLSRTAFSYGVEETATGRIDYARGIGNYLRIYPGAAVDFSSMRISGSVLNAAEITRNIGVAIAFFDEQGNQVGSEIVQVNNARPDVPYPFTTTVEMALERPFASSTQYVLYADPAE